MAQCQRFPALHILHAGICEKNLYRHDQSSRFHPDNVTDNNMVSAGRALLAGSVNDSRFYVTADVKKYVFSKMMFDLD